MYLPQQQQQQHHTITAGGTTAQMEVELMRLSTFRGWPGNVPVDVARIAKGGFFATGNGQEVQCYWCKNRISDWRYGDQVMARHRALDPLCPFVTNPNESGNVPIMSEMGTVDLMNEQCRLATFKNWTVPYVTPQSLAKAGFYYYNQSDRVRCAWCHGVIAEWEEGDNPFAEHEKFFPQCPRVGLGPNIEIAGDDIEGIGIQQIRTPQRERFATLDARIRTFAKWPSNDIQPPDRLATAGFYYNDKDDHVRCFHCNGGLRLWQKEDDPWFEHAKWFPKCQFVELVKGSQYIADVRDQSVPSVDVAREHVQMALQMGLDQGRIRAAIKQRLDATGRPFASVEALVAAVLDGSSDEDDEQESSSSIVREVGIILENIFNPRPQSSTALRMVQQSDDDEPVEHTVVTSSNAGDAESSSPIPAVERCLVPNPPPSSQLSVSAPAATCDQASLEEENRILKDARLCKVCMDNDVGVLFLPCGHLVTCPLCAITVTVCPLCRISIKAYARAFLS